LQLKGQEFSGNNYYATMETLEGAGKCKYSRGFATRSEAEGKAKVRLMVLVRTSEIKKDQ